MVTIKSRLTFDQFLYCSKLSTVGESIMAHTRNKLTALPVFLAAQEKHWLWVLVLIQRCQHLFLVISVHVEILKIELNIRQPL